ncbi:response regulator transcription factor [Muricauda sp. 2012CJ35-5]|uniref:Response regulator transcription factor n=1 Tax=Flagellimonas spongiicola TaxID=2942208 RepID=A0ABT0PW42_9FLAO|nr:response regulator transcription factor [Allomuricauda spongiicola]MCL6275589.1 response regulator transcription factor [Allomuricauda spongiicola]
MHQDLVNTIVADDEMHSRSRILRLLEKHSTIKVVDECANGRQTIDAINNLQPDLLFLDIQLKDLTGFDVLKAIDIEKAPLVIFATAFDEYAIKAFDFFAFDYLLKPFDNERFDLAVERALNELKSRKSISFEDKLSEFFQYIDGQEKSRLTRDETKLPIRHGSTIELVDQDQIKHIIASGYYVDIFTVERKYLLRESLTKLMSKLNSQFIRIHRSTIININYIRQLEYTAYGDIVVIMKYDERFKVSKSYKKNFQNKFDI